MAVRYYLSFPRPNNHLFLVTIKVETWESHTDFIMPAWTPGSYKIRDFAKNVEGFTSNKPFKKIDKSRWRVFGHNPTVSYKAYAFELSVRTSHLDNSHAYINGTSVFMYPESQRNSAVSLRITKPRNWRVATSLRKAGSSTYSAQNYDALADSPIEISNFDSFGFEYRGKRHEFVFHGKGNYNKKKLISDTGKIIRECEGIFGELPYENYTFIVHLTSSWGGGLEHANSTSLQYTFFDFEPHSRYVNFAHTAAHEFFHLWNVKRIIPEKLYPFDYEKEMHTGLLWLMEGVTDYYASLLLVRAGIVSKEKFLEDIASKIKSYEERPGSKVQSLYDSSFDTWIKQYQPNEQSINSTISYYHKGLLVGFALDLALRQATKNRKTLDHCMRELYKFNRSIPEDGLQQIVADLTSKSFDKFFDDYVFGAKEVDFGKFLAYAGYRLTRQLKKDEKGPMKNRAYLGAVVTKYAEKVTITNVLEGSPAMRDGLSASDEIVAIDGYRVSPESWDKQLYQKTVGDKVCFTLFRNHLLCNVVVELGGKDELEYKIVPLDHSSRLQRSIASWIEPHSARAKR